MAMTLEELKAQVEAEDADTGKQKDENAEKANELKSAPQVDENELAADVAEQEGDESAESADLDAKESDESDVESWMQSGSHESQAVKKFTDGDIGKAKAPLKAKLVKKDSEIDQLRAEIEALKSAPELKQQNIVKPVREDFYDADDPDEAYTDALIEYKLNKNQASMESQNAAKSASEIEANQAAIIAQKVDAHYQAAEKLAEKSGIQPEAYQAADMVFRQAIESILPSAGDSIADGLIAKLGAGSEKVTFNLGVNATRRNEFINLLKDDNTGLSAMAFLGELKATLNAPAKRKSNAPAPVDEQTGDKGKAVTVNERKLQDAYKAAEKSGNMQAMFDVRSKARAAGLKNINSW